MKKITMSSCLKMFLNTLNFALFLFILATLPSLQLICCYLQWQKSLKTPVQFTHNVCGASSKLSSLFLTKWVCEGQKGSIKRYTFYSYSAIWEGNSLVIIWGSMWITSFLSNIKNSAETWKIPKKEYEMSEAFFYLAVF